MSYELNGIEILLVRPETQRGPGVLLADLADLFQVGGLFAIGKGHVVFLAAAPDPDLEVF